MPEALFYYLRENGKPYGCVCIQLNLDDLTINRGVSLCSKEDRFDSHDGKSKAFGRMLSALKHNATFNPFKQYNGDFDKILCPDCEFEYKSYYRVKPTDFEYRMLNKPE